MAGRARDDRSHPPTRRRFELTESRLEPWLPFAVGALVLWSIARREPIDVGRLVQGRGLLIVGVLDAGHVGEGLRLAPRGAANVTLVVPPDVGQFEFACFVVGHYESGMKGIAPTPAARPTAAPGHTMDAEDAEQH